MIQINNKQARVCIDPGHGGNDPGAVGPSSVREAVVALKIAKEVMFQLEELGIDSYLTRTEDEFVSLSGRVNESKGSDCMVSIHCNAHSSQAQGIETIYSSAGGKHKALANYVQQSLMKYCQGHKDRGIKMSPSDGYPRKLFVLSAAVIPTCLTEVEFISNVEQEKWLDSDEGQTQIAYAIAQGIKSFLMSLPGAIKSDDRSVEGHPQVSMAVSKQTVEPKLDDKEVPVMRTETADLLAQSTADEIAASQDPTSIFANSNEVEKTEVDLQKKDQDADSSNGLKGSGLKRKSKRRSKS